MQLFKNIEQSINSHIDRNAFFINGVAYTYKQFAETISKIRKGISSATKEDEKNIGVVANDDLETYAAIIALWLEGRAYVPLSPETPRQRNENVIKQAGLDTIIDSSANAVFPELKVIESKKLDAVPVDLNPKNVSDEELAYILFTSGTTGNPKGVPITRANVTGFIEAFEDFKLDITKEDRCLQMFELTFDLSVMSYLVPILKGACVYTIPKDQIKYSYIAELMEDQALTVALMVPSILHFLRPYFSEVNCPKMRYNLFCGEALPLDITNEWSQCLPNAKIMNVYGPTEDTIFCTFYHYNRNAGNKSHHGIMSIGKAMKETYTIIIDADKKVLPAGETGELCLGGIQLTPGYWKNEEKNKEAFFHIDYKGKPTRFYKTGDLCRSDEEGDILYLSRLDNQIKIQGFRVELSEIEFFCKEFLKKVNAIAVAFENKTGNTEIGLIFESAAFDTAELMKYLKTKMPAYMIPTQTLFEMTFPLNSNGKTDRNLLKKKLLEKI